MYLLTHSFCGSRVLARLFWIFCSGSYQAKIKVLARLCSHLEAWWEESVSKPMQIIIKSLQLCHVMQFNYGSEIPSLSQILPHSGERIIQGMYSSFKSLVGDLRILSTSAPICPTKTKNHCVRSRKWILETTNSLWYNPPFWQCRNLCTEHVHSFPRAKSINLIGNSKQLKGQYFWVKYSPLNHFQIWFPVVWHPKRRFMWTSTLTPIHIHYMTVDQGKDTYNENSYAKKERMGNCHRSVEIMKPCWAETVKNLCFSNGVNFPFHSFDSLCFSLHGGASLLLPSVAPSFAFWEVFLAHYALWQTRQNSFGMQVGVFHDFCSHLPEAGVFQQSNNHRLL